MQITQPEQPPTNHPLKFLRLLISIPVDLYMILMLLMLVGWFVTGERLWFVSLFANLMPAIFYPLILVLPLNLLLRRWYPALLLLPALVTFLWLYGGRWLPAGSAVAASTSGDAASIKLMSHNLYMDNNSTDLSIELIMAVAADIVLFQELNTRMAADFESQLSAAYPYMALYPRATERALGRGLISRYPIQSDELVNHASRSPLYQRVEIAFDDTTIVVYNVHLDKPELMPFRPEMRSAGLLFMLEAAAKETQPLIIMGDFNASDQSIDYQRIGSVYTDVFTRVGSGLGTTFPHLNRLRILPFVRIDYAFVSPDWIPIEASVESASAHHSDHYPLVTRLLLD